MKHIVDRKKRNRMWSILFCLLLSGVLGGCSFETESLYSDLGDLAGKRLAVYHGVLGDSLAQVHFPGADLKDYDKTLNLFIDIEGGKRDAVVMDGVTADVVMATNSDYTCLGRIGATAEGVGGIAVMVPTRQYAPLTDKEGDARGWLLRWKERIYRNLFADEAWHLITGGFYTTVVIFLGAAVFAFLLAVLLTYMGINHKWGWLYHPLHWFVFTIHDIPSVVLMMFFYYVVFASTSLSGIVVAAIALGVYTSASLTKIFKIHITQVSKEQRESGLMLGLTSRQVYRYVVFPQAVRTMLPLVIAELKLLLRSTSYAGYIAQKDLVKAVDAIRGVTFDAFLPLLIVSLLYLLLSWLIAKSVGGMCQKLFVHD